MPHRARCAPAMSPAYDLRARHVTLESLALGIAKSFYIFVPPDLPAEQRAPALYLLRGHEREWINRREDQTRAGTNVIDVYERLRLAGTIGPFILVFPGLSSDDNHVPGMIVNMRAAQLAGGAPGIGTGQFEDYFFDELIPYVDAHFPTIPERRGLAGFSLGGAMAIKAAAQRPEMFLSAGAYDGTFLYAVQRGQAIRTHDRVIHNPMFDAAYNVPRDYHFIANNSPANLILRGEPSALSRITWMISYGPREREPWHANYYRGTHLLRCLRARGLSNTLSQGALPDGDHTWHTADRFMAITLPLHNAALNRG